MIGNVGSRLNKLVFSGSLGQYKYNITYLACANSNIAKVYLKK